MNGFYLPEIPLKASDHFMTLSAGLREKRVGLPEIFSVILDKGRDIFNGKLFGNDLFIPVQYIDHWSGLHIIIEIKM